MKENNVTDRLTYLAEQFDVFECSFKPLIDKKIRDLNDIGYSPKLLTDNKESTIAIISVKQKEKERLLKKISVSSDVFVSMISADPTENKIYLQWMLNIFVKLLKDGTDSNIAAAIRFVSEDLPQAKDYLELFENNKRKKKFFELCKANYSLIHIKDFTNINQYKSLSQLFDAVDPFIEKNPSAVERTLQKFVATGQALIPVKDRKFTLYIPKTTAASVVFSNFSNWCTAREGNGMFNSYRTNNKKPNGKDSDIYIIINNKFFSNQSDEIYQIHFETGQIKDRQNGQNISIFESVLSESEALKNFFYEELMEMAKTFKKGIENNKYLDFLIQFGFTESLFDLLDEYQPTIRFMSREIPKLPDISRFKFIEQIIITGAKMVDLHPSIGKMSNLQLLVLTDNRIKTLPKEIGLLKNLEFINLVGNPIKEIPDEISLLDKSNGGSLHRIGVRIEDIGKENFNKLKKLLPKTLIN